MKYLRHLANLTIITIILVLPFFVFGAPDTANKANPANKLKTSMENSGYNTTGDETALASNVGYIIGVFLGIMGTIFVIMMVFAGYNWFTAMGDEKKVGKAKDIIWRAIIGLMITLSAWAIWAFVSSKLIG